MSRRVHLPSISGIARVDACPGSEVILDRINSAGDSAQRGTELHEFCDAVGVRGVPRDDALAMVSEEWRDVCAALDVAKVYEGIVSGLRSEVAYAVNITDGAVRELGHHLDRNYPETATFEVKGSEDFEGVLADGRAIVGDIKTGQDVGSPRTNWQLRVFAYCAMIRLGVDSVVARLAYVRDDGSVDNEECVFRDYELLGVPDDLFAIWTRSDDAVKAFEATGQITVNPGDHCKYCNGFTHCPAKTGIVRHMAGDLESMRDRFAALTNDEAAKAWAWYEAVKGPFFAGQDALKEFARAQGIDLEDGRKVRGVESMRSSFSKERAIDLLKAKGATEEEIQACMVSAKVVSVRALGKKRKVA